MWSRVLLSLITLCLGVSAADGADRTIGVYVALADTKHQGIGRVPQALGNGDDPERNLYWGSAEGLKTVFDASADWKLVDRIDTAGASDVMRVRVYRNEGKGATLTARAYRGSAMKTCVQDFEAAIVNGSHDLVVFIGHNGLMDFSLLPPTKSDSQVVSPDCIVLCCLSEDLFKRRIEMAGGRPVLLTTQFMYPGSFILLAALDPWLEGKGRSAIRESAGVAYAKNQKLSRKAGLGVFAELPD